MHKTAIVVSIIGVDDSGGLLSYYNYSEMTSSKRSYLGRYQKVVYLPIHPKVGEKVIDKGVGEVTFRVVSYDLVNWRFRAESHKEFSKEYAYDVIEEMLQNGWERI